MNLKLLIFGIALSLTVGLFIFRKIKRHFQFKLKYLKALGVFHENKKDFTEPGTKIIREKITSSSIGIYKVKNKIILTKYNTTFSIHEFEKIKSNIEHILRIKVDHISSRKPLFPWRQPEIVLHIENFKKSFSFSECPRNLKPGQYWLGKTALDEDLILDLMKGDFSLGIFALAGAGKGNAIMAVASSFLDTWKKANVAMSYRVMILDAKGTDYHSLIKKYPGTKSLNPIFLEELREAVFTLEEYKTEIDEYRKYLADNGITISHWLKIKDKYPGLKPIPNPMFLICDELSQYMTPRPSIRLNKDSTQEQIQLKEQYELEEKLAFLVNGILQLFRSSGVFVILSNQSLKVEELNLQRTNIINFLLGRNTATMSRLLVGDEKTLTDTSLSAGRFIFTGNGKIIKTQVPFMLTDDN